MAKIITYKDFQAAQPQDYDKLLREMAENPAEEQEAVLMDIIQSAKDTEFGKDHGFADIKTIADYTERISVGDLSAYEDYIPKVEAGEADILFPGKVFEFGGTTGTTGKSKLIPESEVSDLVKRLVVKLRTAESSLMFPAQTVAGNKKFTITNSSVLTVDGKSITSASGQAVARADAAARARLVIPVELLQIKGIDVPDLDYLTILFGIAEKNVVTLISNNVIHFYNLYKRLNANPEMFFDDIEQGTFSVNMSDEDLAPIKALWKANPERAAELRKIYAEKGSLEVADFWPNFGLVNCWLSSSVGRYAKEYAYLFPKDTLFIHWGYGATEGKFDIPVEPFSPKGIPALFGYFFEFLELGADKPVMITGTEPGKYYELVITSYSGLYRYNIHDIVTVVKGDDGLYRLEFICKSYDSICLNGKMLYASEITEYIEQYEEAHGIFIRYFKGEDVGGKLLLHAEPSAPIDAAEFESFIREKLAASGFTLDHVDIMPEGSREKALVVKFGSKTVNQTKLLVFK